MTENIFGQNIGFLNFLRNMTLVNTNPIIIKYKMPHLEIEVCFNITLLAIGEFDYRVDIVCRVDDDEYVFADLSKINVVFANKVIAHLPKHHGDSGNPHMLWTMRTTYEMEGSLVNILEAVWVMVKKLSKIHYDVWQKAVNPDAASDE